MATFQMMYWSRGRDSFERGEGAFSLQGMSLSLPPARAFGVFNEVSCSHATWNKIQLRDSAKRSRNKRTKCRRRRRWRLPFCCRESKLDPNLDRPSSSSPHSLLLNWLAPAQPHPNLNIRPIENKKGISSEMKCELVLLKKTMTKAGAFNFSKNT